MWTEVCLRPGKKLSGRDRSGPVSDYWRAIRDPLELDQEWTTRGECSLLNVPTMAEGAGFVGPACGRLSGRAGQ